jgi:hypothetical protein
MGAPRFALRLVPRRVLDLSPLQAATSALLRVLSVTVDGSRWQQFGAATQLEQAPAFAVQALAALAQLKRCND